MKCRISDDPEGRRENVETQEAWGRAYAAERWPDLPVEIYIDNDITAADRRKTRPDFERFCDDLASGRIAHVVCTNRNRITRDLNQWIDMVDDLFIPAGVEEIHTRHRGVQKVDDIATDIDAVLGRREIKVTRQLVLDKHEALFAAGRPKGGRHLGFAPAKRDGVPTLAFADVEADAIYEGALAVTRGWSLSSIARDWNKREVPQPRSGEKGWVAQSVRAALVKPASAGWRTHRRDPGRLRRGNWRPILAAMVYRCPEGCETRVGYRDDIPGVCEPHSHPMADVDEPGRDRTACELDDSLWSQVVGVLDARRTITGLDGHRRSVARTHATHRAYLLSGGLLTCGYVLDEERAAKLDREVGIECACFLVGNTRSFPGWRDGEPIPYYVCHQQSRGPGPACMKIGISAEPVEEWVQAQFREMLRSSEFAALLAAGDTHAERRRELKAELVELDEAEAEFGRMWARQRGRDGSLAWDATLAEFAADRSRLTAQLTALPLTAPAFDPLEVEADWDEMTIEERRHFLGLYLDGVVVRTARPGHRLTDDELAYRLDIRPRTFG